MENDIYEFLIIRRLNNQGTYFPKFMHGPIKFVDPGKFVGHGWYLHCNLAGDMHGSVFYVYKRAKTKDLGNVAQLG